MIKGINHQVVEITKPSCDYFEKVLFFVKPECVCVSEGKLRDRANYIANNTGRPPVMKAKKKTLRKVLTPLFWFGLGIAATALITKIF
ncbi:hypothetical protein SDC9_181516 [bioreactor metagenome]|uniref:Uncharacterized protein n=1 Tax=bioreactor metagenome TaxID=1076179 RepID=A0A645HD49_9ZZZZ